MATKEKAKSAQDTVSKSRPALLLFVSALALFGVYLAKRNQIS